MQKIKSLLVASSLLALEFVIAPLSANAQVVWIHRKADSQTIDHLYTQDLNEAPSYTVQAINYFGLSQDSFGGSWYALNRYVSPYFTPPARQYFGQLSPLSSGSQLIFEGTLGYFYSHKQHISCSISLAIFCNPICNTTSCPPPPGMRTLYSLTWRKVISTQGKNVAQYQYQQTLLTTSIEERNQLLSSGRNQRDGWGCTIDTAAGNYPINAPKPNDCVLGFVY